jgi:hypothetical protein
VGSPAVEDIRTMSDEKKEPLAIRRTEAMRRAGVKSPTTWRKFCHRHGLPANKPGEKRLYLVADIERAIEAEAAIKSRFDLDAAPVSLEELQRLDKNSSEWAAYDERMKDLAEGAAAEGAAAEAARERGETWPPPGWKK